MFDEDKEDYFSIKERKARQAAEPEKELSEQANVSVFGPELKSTLMLLAIPAVMVVSFLVLKIQMPKPMLYGIAAVLGGLIAFRSLSNPEWLVASFIIYMPFNKEFVIPLLPGLNGTNLFVLMMLISWFSVASKEKWPVFRPFEHTPPVGVFFFLSFISIITVSFTISVDYMQANLLSFKEWVFQFIIYYAVLNLIRDGAVARRVIVYMLIGFVLVLVFGFDQLLERSGYSSIEKSRVPGPQGQPNEFGGFIVYNAGFFLAMFYTYFPRKISLPLIPLLGLMFKVLLGTFSRGAYLGLALASFIGAFIRGKAFLVSMILLSFLLVSVFPEMIPASITDRFSNSQVEDKHGGKKLDKSSEHRLILWDAALSMTMESPILGKGYRGFHGLKQYYTRAYVHESDTHNLYLYIASCMGIPALIVFLAIMYKVFRMSYRLHRQSKDSFVSIIGLAGTMMVVGILSVNIFGTRFNDIGTNGYFWVYLAVLAHLLKELDARPDENN